MPYRILTLTLLGVYVATIASAAEPTISAPGPVKLQTEELGDGWTKWSGFGDIEGALGHRERVTCLHVASANNVWVGTSRGRVLRNDGRTWTLEAHLTETQVTGIAVDDRRDQTEEIVWLSTSDGMGRLRSGPHQHGWTLDRYREHYQGEPGFVSGVYLPGEDSIRLWGYVDHVFLPRESNTYGPYVVSSAHGLFTWSGTHGVWHHFLPHFWGANSAWLDTRDLASLRRPTCVIEDPKGNLWIGTEGDGIVRVNAHARRYHQRPPSDNDEDGSEFSFFGSDNIGCDVARVNDLAAGKWGHLWAAISGNDKRRFIGRYDGNAWSLFEFPRIERHATRNGQHLETRWWQATPLSIAEVERGRILIGVEHAASPNGLFELNWKSGELRRVSQIEHAPHQIQRAADGSVWVQTWWNIYHHAQTDSR